MPKDFRLEVRVKNNLLLKKIEAFGFSSIKKFCIKNNLSYMSIIGFINLRKSPWDSCAHNLKPSCSKLLDVLGCEFENVFSEDIINCRVRQKYIVELERGYLENYQHEFLETADPNFLIDFVEIEQRKEIIDKAINGLIGKNQKEVILGRLDGKTFVELSSELKVSVQRVKQICKAATLQLINSAKETEPKSNAEILKMLSFKD